MNMSREGETSVTSDMCEVERIEESVEVKNTL